MREIGLCECSHAAPPCTTTQLISRPSPEGILYTSARDSLVVAWDLNIPMRNRVHNDRITQNVVVSVGNSSLAVLRVDFAYHSSTYVGTINMKIYTFLAQLARG